MKIDAGIVPRIEISYQLHSRSEAAAADVEQSMMRHQAMRNQEVELKLADIVINVTAGGPGGATDTVSSFIYREYRDRSNVGYGTMLAEFYLVIIIIFVSLLLTLASRWMRRVT